MKVIRMQYSPDAFDSFINQKLDEVEVDTSAASQHWKQMPTNLGKKGGGLNNNIVYIILGTLIVASLIFFIYNENKSLSPTVPVSNAKIKFEERLQGKNKNADKSTAVTLPENTKDVITKNKVSTTGKTGKTLSNQYAPKIDRHNSARRTIIQKIDKRETSTVPNPLDLKQTNTNIISTPGNEKVEQHTTPSTAIKKDGIVPDSTAQKKFIKPPAEQQKKKPGPRIIW